MRESLQKLIEQTVIFEYHLPHDEKDIDGAVYSTENDHCYSSSNDKHLAEIIYNAVVDYAFNEYELDVRDYANAHMEALQTRIRYEAHKEEDEQLKYGFFGEVLLYCVLCIIYKTTPIISKGHFYSPVENSESKGFDSYHMVEHEDGVSLWFGEVKFHASRASGIKSALKGIEHVISDEYLNKNLNALPAHTSNLNLDGSKIDLIIKDWRENPSIKILETAKKHNIKLVYPILLLFDESSKGYDESIRGAIEYIAKNYEEQEFNISIEVSIFFIFIPVENSKKIKMEVLKWIGNKQPLMS